MENSKVLCATYPYFYALDPHSISKFPREDWYSYYYSLNITLMVVADGITRDCLDQNTGEVYPVDKHNIDKSARDYPLDLNPAGRAAKVFCLELALYIQQKRAEINVNNATSILREAVVQSNHQLKKLQNKLGLSSKVDYLYNDLAGCVASGALILGNKLLWFAQTDCRLGIIRDEQIFFLSNNYMQNFIDACQNDVKIKDNIWIENESRVVVRRDYRNKVSNPSSYGAFTGESEAIDFVHFGIVDLEQDDIIFCASDGLEVYLDNLDKQILGGFTQAIIDSSNLSSLIPFENFRNKLFEANPGKMNYAKESTITVTKI